MQCPDLVLHADSLRFDIIDHVMLIVHANVPPVDADWTRVPTESLRPPKQG